MSEIDRVVHSLSIARKSLDDLLTNESSLQSIIKASEAIATTFNQRGKVYSCGNGGSMCDAMHFAEELSGRYRGNRRPLAAVSISDPSHMSCVANDFGYEHVFSRFIEAHADKIDCVLAISTSGNSESIISAAKVARSIGCTLIALHGKAGSKLEQLCDINIYTPAGDYADRVQELHIKVIHILIQLTERKLGLA